jgi:flagellar biosynthetic protein FliR
VDFSVGYPALVAFLFAFARALGWLMLVPPFSNRGTVPTLATICIASGLGLLVGPLVPAATIPTTTAGLIGGLLFQVLTGAAMGYIIYLLISTATVAGSLLDLSGGLNLPPSIDPLSLDQVSMLGQLYQQVAIILLFVSGGYMVLIDGFARSFAGPGFSLAVTGRIAETAVIDLSTMFTSALEIAAPILVVLFAAQIMLAMLTKAAPQMNVWVLGMPIQIFLAIILVAIGISTLPSFVGHILTRALEDSSALFGAH